MEFASAGSLARLCQEKGGLPDKLARGFLAQMLLGLEYLHANSIAHRDIKGANCLLFPPPHSVRGDVVNESALMVKLADFGASRMFDIAHADSSGDRNDEGFMHSSQRFEKDAQDDSVGGENSNMHGLPHGTANWMAPEVILNEKSSRSADIWSYTHKHTHTYTHTHVCTYVFRPN
jgi:serine/threonine protein kinase